MRKFLFGLSILAFLAAISFWYWTGTPQYSVIKLTEALRNHDGDEFRRYFDVEGVSALAVEDLLSQQVRQVGGEGLLQRFVGKTLAGIFKPELGSLLAKNIMDYVEKSDRRASKNSQGEEQLKSPEQAQAVEQTKAEQAQTERPGPIRRAVRGFVDVLVDTISKRKLERAWSL